MGSPIFAGIDVGSTTVKYVTVDSSGDLRQKNYVRSHGRPYQTLLSLLSEILEACSPDSSIFFGFTGSGGERIARLFHCDFVNEIIVQPRGVDRLAPGAENVIEMGGQDAKFLVLGRDSLGNSFLVDAALNDLCAAGTGSFLDQQALRLGIPVEDLGALALEGKDRPASIAGRCTVFCKSDMVHLQQIGAPLSEIVAGVCLAVARNFKQTLINKLRDKLGKRYVFQGGVANNQGMIWAFEKDLGLSPGSLIVPEHKEVVSALGTALTLLHWWESLSRMSPAQAKAFRQLHKVRLATISCLDPLWDSSDEEGIRRSTPLMFPGTSGLPSPHGRSIPASGPIEVLIGIDSGSTTTKLAALNWEGDLIFSRYCYTSGDPLARVREMADELARLYGDRLRVLAAGVTGSGRHVTGQLVGADLIVDEITAQSAGIRHLVSPVDTIFEIGGQDSKFITFDDNGVVRSFEMNKACAAGTGAFLEEQAGKLRLDIRREFEDLAFRSTGPCRYNATCSVFMESDLVANQQKGADAESLVAGLALSIVHNYLDKVARRKEIGRNVVFSGGVAQNRAVVSAFEKELAMPILVAPHSEVTGAIGAALLASMEKPGTSRFRGFSGIGAVTHDSREVVCKACANYCTVQVVRFGKDPPCHYGARCDKFERTSSYGTSWEDLAAFRQALFFEPWEREAPPSTGPVVGIPLSLFTYELFPLFWKIFSSLGIRVLLSAPSNGEIVKNTYDTCRTTPCMPYKLVYGHVQWLLDRNVDVLFIPTVLARNHPDDPSDRRGLWCCNYLGCAGSSIRSGFGFGNVRSTAPWRRLVSFFCGAPLEEGVGEKKGKYILYPPLDLSRPIEEFAQNMVHLALYLGVPGKAMREAVHEGYRYFESLQVRLKEKGRQILAQLRASPDTFGVALIGRPYMLYDPRMNLDLPRLLHRLGIPVIPSEFFDVKGVDISRYNPNMFWHSGQVHLRCAELARTDPQLYSLYLTCFGCGPDSFILNFYRDGASRGKPSLVFESDEHSGTAGVQTRAEAFVNSIRAARKARAPQHPQYSLCER